MSLSFFFLFVRSCFLITLIKCLKGQKSQRLLLEGVEGVFVFVFVFVFLLVRSCFLDHSQGRPRAARAAKKRFLKKSCLSKFNDDHHCRDKLLFFPSLFSDSV